ncbi:MAG: hypothetical protein CR997_12280 [Acidobacteria bacterium]|nr:MAG: hypothetical protein CR997_12280 [Acidobacteriota bacterium]
MIIKSARELAVACMLEVEAKGLLVNEAISEIGLQLPKEDMAFAHEIAYGTFRYFFFIEEILKQYCKKPLKKLPPFLQWLLRSSVYQLKMMRTPDYAVINEAVNIAQKRGFKRLKPVVNGILRQVQRNLEKHEYHHERHFLPAWYKNQLQQQFASGTVSLWLENWKESPLQAYWNADEPAVNSSSERAMLPHVQFGHPDMRSGRVYIQNESAQAIAEIVCRSSCRRVLDTCAAPGGKTCYMAAFGQIEKLTASDISARRLKKMQENLQRLNLKAETHLITDDHPVQGHFDLVLVDAPCSAMGIIARHPELKFLRTGHEHKQLLQTQQNILNSAWRRVEPGGFLLYTVCTLNKRELPAVPTEAVLAEEELKNWLPAGVPWLRPQEGHFVIPPSHRFDGFSGFLIKKKPV